VTARRRGWRRNRGTPAPRGFLPAPLPGPHPRAGGAPPARARRGPVLAATGIGGAALLGMSLSTEPGSPQFYLLTTGLAGTWAAGALSTGPLPLAKPGRGGGAPPLVTPVLIGAAAFGVFYGASSKRYAPPAGAFIAATQYFQPR